MMSPSQVKSLSGATVMVVDDEFLIGLDTGWILQDAGAVVLGPFTTLPPSFEALSKVTPSLAVVDFRLSATQTSASLIAALAARGVPVIVYTGQRLNEEILGADAIIFKPASQQSLVETAVALLDPSSALRSRNAVAFKSRLERNKLA